MQRAYFMYMHYLFLSLLITLDHWHKCSVNRTNTARKGCFKRFLKGGLKARNQKKKKVAMTEGRDVNMLNYPLLKGNPEQVGSCITLAALGAFRTPECDASV